MIGAGHDRAAARLFHDGFDLGRIGRNHHRTERGGFGPAQDVHDHRYSGDIGERFARQPGAAMRAGMTISTSAIEFGKLALYTGCKTRGKPAISAPPCLAPSAVAEPFSDEFVRNQQDSRRASGNLPGPAGPPHRFGSDLLTARAGQARLRNRRKEEKAGATEAEAAPQQPIENLLASASVEHGAQLAKQCGACHNFQEGQGPRSVPISMASSGGSRLRGRLQLLGGAEGEERHLDLRRAEQMADRSSRHGSRHGHDFRRSCQREAARRHHRLSRYAFEESRAAAEGDRKRPGQQPPAPKP